MEPEDLKAFLEPKGFQTLKQIKAKLDELKKESKQYVVKNEKRQNIMKEKLID